jgi:replicative superfamily II helicase
MKISTDYTGFPNNDIELNPMQELIVPYIDELIDRNLIVSAPTASGKSTVPKMLGKHVLDAGKNIIYIGIMKALAEEKADDWANDNWAVYPQATITSDFRVDPGYEQKIKEARVVCITPESLASRLRKTTKGDAPWLDNAGLLVIDEIHLIGDGSRGANLEAAIIEFCHQHPNCRVVGLSATMPNVNEVAKWIETLTGKTTDVVHSTYRPVPIQEYFLPYTPASKNKNDVEDAKTSLVTKIVTDASKINEQFLVAVFNKSYGRSLLQTLKDMGVSAEFHNADIGDRSKKKQIEDNFKAGRIRVLISTSTLFTGVNLPARNVIITAVEVAQQDIAVYTLKQAAGRAGRPKYDTEGDVFYLIPSAREKFHIERIERGEPIRSQLSTRTMLAIHVVGAIYLGRIENQNDFHTWYKHTLAFEQGVRDESKIDLIRQNVMESLSKMGVVYIKNDEDNVEHYKLSRVGIISAQMYLDPFHYVSALLAIKKYSLLDNPSEQDFIRAMCMWDAYQTPSISYDEKLALPSGLPSVPDGYKKIAAVIKFRISGEKVPMQFYSMNAMVYNDISRMHVAIERALNEAKTGIELSNERLDAMFARVISQCSWEQANLAVAKFTKKEREKLNAQGIYTVTQAKNNAELTRSIIGDKRITALGVSERRQDSYGVTRFGK